ncbi:hypothetical protein H3C66_02875 [Patescibacteria group bacterium]|nr:hypothetical protein [Patescibacteria group bacterium]
MEDTVVTHSAKITKRRSYLAMIVALLLVGSFSVGFLAGSYYPKVLGRQTSQPALPLVPPDPTPDEPLRKYSIQNLQSYPFQVSEITIERVLERNTAYTSYVFSYKTLGKKMSGQLNIPVTATEKEAPVIVMVRGYVDAEEFHTGSGTSPVASEFAKAGYITVAPDFLGFGNSDQPGPGWESRFEKPVNVIELIQSLRLHNSLTFKDATFKMNPNKMGIWAHSNGGQIAITTLEAIGEPIPLAVWAPVTAPFPYSVLYYSDEMDDGGAGMRSALAGFEQVYNVQEYSLTQHLNRLRSPVQLHQGTADDAVPKKWSDEFVKKIKAENDRRTFEQERLIAQQTQLENERKAAIAATASAVPSPVLIAASPSSSAATQLAASQDGSSSARILSENVLTRDNLASVNTSIRVEDAYFKPIDITYYVYQGGNHFMRPGWEEAVSRDVSFFAKHLNVR